VRHECGVDMWLGRNDHVLDPAFNPPPSALASMQPPASAIVQLSSAVRSLELMYDLLQLLIFFTNDNNPRLLPHKSFLQSPTAAGCILHLASCITPLQRLAHHGMVRRYLNREQSA
jgi:hypothetical protein